MKLEELMCRAEIEAEIPYRTIAAVYKTEAWRLPPVKDYIRGLDRTEYARALSLCRTAKLWVDKGRVPHELRMATDTRRMWRELGERCTEAAGILAGTRIDGRTLRGRLARLPGRDRKLLLLRGLSQVGNPSRVFAMEPLGDDRIEERLDRQVWAQYPYKSKDGGPSGTVFVVAAPGGSPEILVALDAE